MNSSASGKGMSGNSSGLHRFPNDSASIRLELDTILCTKYLITPADFYADLSKCISSIIGIGNSGNGISDVRSTIIKPSVSGTYGFALNNNKNSQNIQQTEKVKLYLNVGGGIGFLDFLNNIDITNPNFEFDVNTELSIFFSTSARYNTEECLKYSNSYEDFMVPYLYYGRQEKQLSMKLDSIKKSGVCMACVRDTGIMEADTVIRSSRNYRVLYHRVLSQKLKSSLMPSRNGPFQHTQLDSNKIVTYYTYFNNGIEHPVGYDSTISRHDSIFKFRFRSVSSDSLQLKSLSARMQQLNAIHNGLVSAAPFNTRMFHWLNLDLSYKLESYLIYDGKTSFSSTDLSRGNSCIFSAGVNYNFYHFVTTRYRHGRGGFLAWGGNKYVRIGMNLMLTNAADEDNNGPYKVSVIDSLIGGVTYTKKTVTVFTPGILDRRVDLMPHADFYIMENSRTAGLHVATDYIYAFSQNEAHGNKLSAGLGIFISIGRKLSQRIDQLKGIPVNFEILLRAKDMLHWTASTRLEDRLDPVLKINLPLNLIGR